MCVSGDVFLAVDAAAFVGLLEALFEVLVFEEIRIALLQTAREHLVGRRVLENALILVPIRSREIEGLARPPALFLLVLHEGLADIEVALALASGELVVCLHGLRDSRLEAGEALSAEEVVREVGELLLHLLPLWGHDHLLAAAAFVRQGPSAHWIGI
jgi:hypothetical protein